MEYIYAAMLLHSAGQKIDEQAVTKVLQSIGKDIDHTKVKAMVAALEGINIEEAIANAAVAPVAAPAGGTAPAAAKEEKKEEKKEEEAAAGLGALFG